MGVSWRGAPICVIGVLDRGAVRGLQRRPRVGQSLYNISTDLITLEQVGWMREGEDFE